jgi:hypothetical protein
MEPRAAPDVLTLLCTGPVASLLLDNLSLKAIASLRSACTIARQQASLTFSQPSASLAQHPVSLGYRIVPPAGGRPLVEVEETFQGKSLPYLGWIWSTSGNDPQHQKHWLL